MVDGSPQMRNGNARVPHRSTQVLSRYLERCAKEPFDDAMAAVSIAEMIDVLFASRSTREHWDRTSRVAFNRGARTHPAPGVRAAGVPGRPDG